MKLPNKLLFFLAAIACVAASVYYYISGQPRYSFYQVAQSIRNHDVELFNKYVNVDAVVEEWVNWSCEQAKQDLMHSKTAPKDALGENLIELMMPNMRIKLQEEFKRSIIDNVENATVTGGLPLLNMALLPVQNITITNKVAEIALIHPKSRETIVFKMRRLPQRYWRVVGINVPSLMHPSPRPASTPVETSSLPPLPAWQKKDTVITEAQPPQMNMPALAPVAIERDFILTKTMVYAEYFQQIRGKILQNLPFKDTDLFKETLDMKIVLLANGQIKHMQITSRKKPVSEDIIKAVLQATKQASPFPAFPGELTSPEMEFNIPLSSNPD